MRRWLVRISICLLLGAVTTVGVAWGLVLKPIDRVNQLSSSGCTSETEFPSWMVKTYEGFGFTSVSSAAWHGYTNPGYDRPTEVEPPHWSVGASLPPSEADVAHQLSYFEDARGLPRRCLASMSQHHIVDRKGYTRRSFAVELHDPYLVGRLPRALPLRPILPGFLINTLVYGVFWFGLFLGPRAARRTIRRKRGRCVKCGYDLRGGFDRGCPECGWSRAEAESSQ